MKMLKLAMVLMPTMVLGLSGAVAVGQVVESLPADVWVHDGDMDGDGLTDEFETRHGLDPTDAESLGDGVVDENRLYTDGVTMWDAQEAEKAAEDAAEAWVGGCSVIGSGQQSVLAVMGLLWIVTRSRRLQRGNIC